MFLGTCPFSFVNSVSQNDVIMTIDRSLKNMEEALKGHISTEIYIMKLLLVNDLIREVTLLAQQGFEIIDVQVDLIRNLMSKIKGSVNLCDSIRGLCNVERVDHLKPEIDIKTRRDITFCMETTLRTLGTEEASIQNLLPDINGVKQLRKLEN
ncbi:14058_t:CDS:2 [Entrophospora sp. SA101]|nr:14058_t:CDS:2 [Entrophospora sp. SA101]